MIAVNPSQALDTQTLSSFLSSLAVQQNREQNTVWENLDYDQEERRLLAEEQEYVNLLAKFNLTTGWK